MKKTLFALALIALVAGPQAFAADSNPICGVKDRNNGTVATKEVTEDGEFTVLTERGVRYSVIRDVGQGRYALRITKPDGTQMLGIGQIGSLVGLTSSDIERSFVCSWN